MDVFPSFLVPPLLHLEKDALQNLHNPIRPRMPFEPLHPADGQGPAIVIGQDGRRNQLVQNPTTLGSVQRLVLFADAVHVEQGDIDVGIRRLLHASGYHRRGRSARSR